MNPNFIDIDQNSDEWFDLRAGKLTGSAVSKVMANYGKAFGNPAHDLAAQIALEQITGKPILSTYTNAHMDLHTNRHPSSRRLPADDHGRVSERRLPAANQFRLWIGPDRQRLLRRNRWARFNDLSHAGAGGLLSCQKPTSSRTGACSVVRFCPLDFRQGGTRTDRLCESRGRTFHIREPHEERNPSE